MTEGRRCDLYDIPSIEYARAVVEELPYWYTKRFEFENEWAWESDLTTSSSSNVESTDFFIWAGHGHDDGEGPHFFTKNSTLVHDFEAQNQANAGWSEIRWSGVNWATMYTCNFFNPSSSAGAMFQMCEGIHFFVGFNQRMYMDSAEGGYYGYMIGYPSNPMPISQAFTEAARAYQIWHGSDATRTVTLGATSTFGDKVNSYAADPPSYSSNPSLYQYLETAL